VRSTCNPQNKTKNKKLASMIHYNRARSAVICKARKCESVAIEGRQLGTTCQHISNISHISLLICGQSSRLGRPPDDMNIMTLASFFICENGMDPVTTCRLFVIGSLNIDGYTHFDDSHGKRPRVRRHCHTRNRLFGLI